LAGGDAEVSWLGVVACGAFPALPVASCRGLAA